MVRTVAKHASVDDGARPPLVVPLRQVHLAVALESTVPVKAPAQQGPDLGLRLVTMPREADAVVTGSCGRATVGGASAGTDTHRRP